MNCEEFRCRLLIDPYSEDPSFAAHAQACPACARAADEALRFEQPLREALSAELSAAQGPQARWRRRAYALLAIPLLLAALGVALRRGPDADADLAAGVLAHIREEEELLARTGTIPQNSVSWIFHSLGAEVDPGLGTVHFAGRCIMGEQEGIHLVLAGERAAVSVLIMPQTQVAAPRQVRGADLTGTILPAERGSMAILGAAGEPLQPIVRRLLQAVRWQ